ncbi:MAG: hypothetical protein ABUS49_04925 [Acidobacteriota bacterium]
MISEWTPLRWPPAWRQASDLNLLKDTPVNCLVMDPGPLAEQAAKSGFQVVRPGAAPPGVVLLEGVWPGIRVSRFGAHDAASAGPTGEPWVDSNVWPVRLAQARNPGAAIWVKTAPRDNTLLNGASLITCMADAALAGGHWIITLTEGLAAALAERRPDALQTWKQIAGAAGYFSAKKEWREYEPAAVPGILSDFATSGSHELLNLTTRAGQQYRVLLKEKFSARSLAGLKAVVSPDTVAPSPAIRSQVAGFVNDGGMLIAGPEWGPVPGSVLTAATHPRYSVFRLGKGSLAIAKEALTDPYLLVNDMGILISHRHDLLRFWNGGPLSALYSAAENREKAAVQVVFYSNRPAGVDTSLRIAGNFTTVRLSTLDQPVPRALRALQKKDAVEINLPGTAGYIAIELEA